MRNRIAIMQPYVFPYIGYMNLINASDHFVFYDDVSFIKKGWINRNRIILMGEPYRFSIPLKQQSSNVLIKDTEVSDLSKFADKFLQHCRVAIKGVWRRPALNPPLQRSATPKSGSRKSHGI